MRDPERRNGTPFSYSIISVHLEPPSWRKRPKRKFGVVGEGCSFCGLPSPLPLLVAAIICAPGNYRVVHLVIFIIIVLSSFFLPFLFESRRLDEPRWPDDWLFALHIIAGVAAFALLLFLVFGRRLFRNRCMSCCVKDKVKTWWALNITHRWIQWSSSKTSVDIMLQYYIAIHSDFSVENLFGIWKYDIPNCDQNINVQKTYHCNCFGCCTRVIWYWLVFL